MCRKHMAFLAQSCCLVGTNPLPPPSAPSRYAQSVMLQTLQSLVTCLHKGSHYFCFGHFRKFCTSLTLLPALASGGQCQCSLGAAPSPFIHIAHQSLLGAQTPLQHSPVSNPYQSLELVLKLESIRHACCPSLGSSPHKASMPS